MGKTQAVLARSPLEYLLGKKIIGPDGGQASIEEISKLNNWIFGRRRECHLSVFTGADGSYTSSIATVNATCTTTLKDIIYTDMWFSKEAAGFGLATFGIEASVPGGETLTVTITLDGASGTEVQTRTYTGADTGELTVAVDISNATPGDEWVDVEIDIQVTTGSGPATLVNCNFEEDGQTSSLPDPIDD